MNARTRKFSFLAFRCWSWTREAQRRCCELNSMVIGSDATVQIEELSSHKLKPNRSERWPVSSCSVHKCKSHLFIFMGSAQSPLKSLDNRRWSSNEKNGEKKTMRKVDGRRKILHSNVNKRENNRNKLQSKTSYHSYFSLSPPRSRLPLVKIKNIPRFDGLLSNKDRTNRELGIFKSLEKQRIE